MENNSSMAVYKMNKKMTGPNLVKLNNKYIAKQGTEWTTKHG